MPAAERISSGIPAMDRELTGFLPGDNIVWQVTDMEDFACFADALARQAAHDGRKLVRIRFEKGPVLPEGEAEDRNAETVRIPLSHRFETFAVTVRKLIRARGRRVVYLFDSLSELQTAWATDLMMGNFFLITAPLLTELACTAYFPIIRGRHSFDAIARIRDAAQVFLDVYHDGDISFIRPMKVQGRFSDTMFLPHTLDRKSGRFRACTDGVEVSRFYAVMNESMTEDEDRNTDSWDRFFRETRVRHEAGEDVSDACRRMCSTMLTRDERLQALILENFTPEDYFEIRSRMVGTGMIGGKAAGMLLSRKLVENHAPDTFARMEPHDSFYIGSDVFYSYIVTNGFWELRVRQRTPEEYFSLAGDFADLLKSGRFSRALEDQFCRLLDYYGQDPFIVRSSSILEDGFGNAFAGKYESVFCSNTGSMEERLREFEEAIRTVYASTMNLSALDYRMRRGLQDRDEQMSLLVMRVSGSRYGAFFMPSAAGVGYSLSPYRFGTDERETSGMLRMVMGLGTAAVDRIQGSYPRLVSMDNPSLQVAASDSERHQFSQRKIDVVNLEKGGFESLDLGRVEPSLPFYMKQKLLTHDTEAERMFRDYGDSRDIYYVSCDGLVRNAPLMEDMKTILRVIADHYEYPVDIEFTINIEQKGKYVINLLQCRPLQVARDYEVVKIPEDIPSEKIFLECRNASMGLSRELALDYVVVIDSIGYYRTPYKEKYRVARALGAVNWHLRNQGKTLMLFAPGRICTSSPELGVPSAFADISEFNVICEMTETGAGYMPELSYGSHIFQDLVEAGILYTAISDDNRTQRFDLSVFEGRDNLLPLMSPEHADIADVVRVYRASDLGCRLYYDMPGEHLVCTVD